MDDEPDPRAEGAPVGAVESTPEVAARHDEPVAACASPLVVVGAAVAASSPVVEVALDVEVEVEVVPGLVVVRLGTALVDVIAAVVIPSPVLPSYVVAARVANPPSAATPARLVPRVMARSRATARSRPIEVGRDARFMQEGSRLPSFDSVTTSGRHRIVARPRHRPAMEWLGELGSTILGAIYANAIPVTVAAVTLAAGLLVVAAARRRPARSASVIGLALAVALPAGWYLGSPLVLTATVDEPAPVIATASTGRASPAPLVPSAGPSSAPSTRPSIAPSSPPPTPRLLARSGSFVGSDDFHFGRGTARLLEVAPGSFIVRLEDFAVRNGPDLYVYLSPAADGYAGGAIELGRLKADRGNQNYRVPDGADVSRTSSVVIWCKQFAVRFATARLA
jgi:hypothetical protein